MVGVVRRGTELGVELVGMGREQGQEGGERTAEPVMGEEALQWEGLTSAEGEESAVGTSTGEGVLHEQREEKSSTTKTSPRREDSSAPSLTAASVQDDGAWAPPPEEDLPVDANFYFFLFVCKLPGGVDGSRAL